MTMKMKKLVCWCVSALLALPWLASAQVNSLPSQPHLLVKGEAKQEVTPDRFHLTVTLRAVDMQPEKARERVQAQATTILGAFKANHVLKDSVEASSLSIGPSYRFESQKRVFEGTEVKRSLSATFTTLEDARGFLGTLQTSEEVQLSGIRPTYSRAAEVRAALKRQAAEQTRSSANALAAAYGVRLGGIYTISDVAPSFAYGVQAGTWPGAGTVVSQHPPAPEAPVAEVRRVDMVSSAESLEAGSLTLSENVYAVFLIAQ
jgi:uncharacterized protein YggE